MQLLVYCSGGFGRVIFDFATRINNGQKMWTDIEFIDDTRKEKEFYSTKVYSFDEIAQRKDKSLFECIIANGEPIYRESLLKNLKNIGINIATIIAPSANLSPTSKIGQGVLIRDYSEIGSMSEIGENVVIQPNIYIGHNVKIGNHCVISAQSFIGGLSEIGERTYIGPGSFIKDRIKIGNNSIVGIGSVVNHNIPDNVIVNGNPAKVISRNFSRKVFGIV